MFFIEEELNSTCNKSKPLILAEVPPLEVQFLISCPEVWAWDMSSIVSKFYCSSNNSKLYGAKSELPKVSIIPTKSDSLGTLYIDLKLNNIFLSCVTKPYKVTLNNDETLCEVYFTIGINIDSDISHMFPSCDFVEVYYSNFEGGHCFVLLL